MVTLTPHLLLSAYERGIFPMAGDDGTVYWYEPHPRTIIPLDGFHLARRLERTVRQGKFEIRVDTDFRGVMAGCADRPRTWISDELVDLYTSLHQMGYAHSVETWRDGRLVGGVYGVALQGLFAGESMFSRERDASKVAIVHLVERLRAGGYQLFDVQYPTAHLRRFGAIDIPRSEYRTRLAEAMQQETDQAVWRQGGTREGAPLTT